MKIKYKIATALVAAGIAAQAGATNIIYLTGSTAFRSTVYNALHTSGVVFDASPAIQEVEFGGSSASGANYMLFLGNIGGTATYIDCAWSGSEAGIASVSGIQIFNQDNTGATIPLAGNPAQWLTNTVALDGYHSASPTSAQLEPAPHIADLSMADTSQAVSLTPYVLGTSTALKSYGTVGIVTFTFCKNVNSSPSSEWSSMANISNPQANVLYSVGNQHTAFFTGNPAQTNEYVYLVGRNKGSGTRANQLADTGYGTTTEVQQFSIGGGIEAGEATGLSLVYERNNGYESGGGVATALGVDGSCQQTDPFFGNPAGQTGWYAVAFLGCSDAITHGLTVANNWLTFEGVPESDGAIEEGQYQLWGHEHMYGRANIGGYQDTDASVIFNGMQTLFTGASYGSVPANHSPAIGLQYMHCTKASDVAYPTRNAGY